MFKEDKFKENYEAERLIKRDHKILVQAVDKAVTEEELLGSVKENLNDAREWRDNVKIISKYQTSRGVD